MAAITAWAASTAYSLGDVRKASTTPLTGVHFKVTTAGTSGSSEPDWSTHFGSETGDNSVVWTAVSATAAELQKSNPSNIIELFVLELNPTIHGTQSQMTYRFHNGTSETFDEGDAASNIVFAGEEYIRFPIEAEGFAYDGKQIPRPTLRISNILGTITTILSISGFPGLEGAKVTRLRTLERYLDDINFDAGYFLLEDSNVDALLLEDGNKIKLEGISNPHSEADSSCQFPAEVYYIDRKSQETREAVEFELAASFDLQGVRLPRRQILPGDFPGVGSFYS